MSQTVFDEVFQKLKDTFPPVDDPQKASLRLTTFELFETITQFGGRDVHGVKSIFGIMKENGYIYIAEEVNGKIVFKWLLGKS